MAQPETVPTSGTGIDEAGLSPAPSYFNTRENMLDLSNQEKQAFWTIGAFSELIHLGYIDGDNFRTASGTSTWDQINASDIRPDNYKVVLSMYSYFQTVNAEMDYVDFMNFCAVICDFRDYPEKFPKVEGEL